tara:strand:- start:831 stop:1163 length:333 start_codon:yes stop_codon:yes gene_type:complete
MRYRRNKIIRNKNPIYEEVLEDKGKNFIRQYALPQYRPLTKEQIAALEKVPHVWSEGDRYYKLAQNYYGDPALWWVIAWFNRKPTEAHVNYGELVYIPIPIEKALSYYGV